MSDDVNYMLMQVREVEELFTELYPTAPVSDGFKNESLRKFLDGWRLKKYDKSSEKHAQAA
jgi:hypothetical protein